MTIGKPHKTEWHTLLSVIATAQRQMAHKVELFTARHRFEEQHYARYLSMQFHLTRGVQRYFLNAAAHSDLAHRKPLRAFLCDFASEEELHFTIADRDLAAMGRRPDEEPFDVALWHSYFTSITSQRPFIRLGAACVLENLSGGEMQASLQKLLSSQFLNRENTRFIVLHQHETIPHGDQILEALAGAQLSLAQMCDLTAGARQGGLFFLRFIDWAFKMNEDERALFGSMDTSVVAA